MKWIPEIAALTAAVVISVHLDMSWLSFFLLWISLDLMTATRAQIDKIRKEVA